MTGTVSPRLCGWEKELKGFGQPKGSYKAARLCQAYGHKGTDMFCGICRGGGAARRRNNTRVK